jgi:D-alanyl-D-alanine carboxypeptidase (penicillin-binding protein 5/6)
MKRNHYFTLALTCFVSLVSTQVLGQAPVPNAAKARPVPAAPQLGANSYLLVDFNSERILVEHNADERVEPASITKLMTAYVVFSELDQGNITLEETVPISERAWRTGGSRMFIEPNMQVSVEDLIRGMVVQSGNDASVALAEHVAGSEEAFANLMNHYAELLGMTATSFMNIPRKNSRSSVSGSTTGIRCCGATRRSTA